MDRRQLRQIVLEKGYVRRGEPFRLSSGGTSRDYVDLRRATARGEDLEVAARALLGELASLGVDYDCIGGMTMGADPVAHAAALIGGGSWFSVRKEEKRHGANRRIEGADVGPGVRAVVVEDTVSTGRSLLDAVEVVRAAGATVVQACTLLDRGDAATAALEAAGVPYLALLTYRDLGIEPLDSVGADGG